METNPFEPPKTSDLDARPLRSGPLALAGASLTELERINPWTRWLVRLAILQIAVSILNTVLNAKPGVIAATLASTFVSILYIAALRRHMAAVDRLRLEPGSAVAAAIDAQASYFRITGVLAIIVMSLIALGIVIGAFSALSKP